MKTFVSLLCIVLCLSITAYATVIHVPGDYATIQLGLNAASTGDTVLVAAETYTENIFWPLVSSIKLFSETGAPSTVIDGGSTSTVIYFSGIYTIDTTTVIQGFTIRNGGGIDYGGGIYLINSSPRIQDNIIKDNSVNEDGGGVYCSDLSSPLIIGNTIRVNSAGSLGGGICSDSSSPVIIQNSIKDNAAQLGAGICCQNYSSPIIASDTINNNLADYGGGGIWCRTNSSPQITNNTISGNSTNGQGGGICCYYSNPTIIGNTISSDTADYGAGIFCDGGMPTITGNTISNNSTHAYGDGGGITIYSSYPGATITYNTITNNSAGSYGGGIYCIGTTPFSINNNNITTNSANDGGGIFCDGSSAIIISNKIISNTAYQNGGGINCNYDSDPPIRFNTIKGNDADSLGDGIYCENNSFPVVDSNNIYNNGYGAYNADNSQLLMAEYNWWGDSSGPYHQTLNPGGLGDSTNIFVDPVPFLTDSVLGVNEEVQRQKPSVTMVKQNYPNPFKRETIIRYHCSEPSKVTMKVYNLLGQEIATLVDKVENLGEHTVRWDASEMSDGVYFYKVTIGNFTETRKCLLVR